MLKNMKLFLRVFTLALMAAFFLRPVVVCVHNSAVSGKTQRENGASWARSQGTSSFKTTLHNVNKEVPPALVLVPRLSRSKSPLPSENPLKPGLAFPGHSPSSFPILRI